MGQLGFLSENESEKKALKDKVMDALKETFKPEFLNRIDEIIIFNHLGSEEIKKIVDIELAKVQKRLKEKDININITDSAKSFIAKEGFDPNLGARPLKRVIQRKILDPLSLKIVIGEINSGDIVTVDFKNGEIVFQKDKKRKKTEDNGD
jgi:ATP-dependent Clp protease ATP-binding subunit ClpA